MTGDGIVKSVDGGNSWVPANDGLIASYGGTLTVSDGKLYAATNETNMGTWNPPTSGIYRLADDGNSWLPIQRKMQSPNDRIYRVNQLLVSGETFYVNVQKYEEERLYRWRVGQDLWTVLSPQNLGWQSLSVSGRTVYVSTEDGKFLRSVDEGDTWTDVSQNLPNRAHKNRIYNHFFVGETIHVNSDDGVFRSRDGGETWMPIANGTPDGVGVELVEGTTFYGTDYRGVFRLTHGSDTWEKLASMMQPYVPARYVTALAFDGTAFYAGTEAEGVFRLSLDK